MEQQDSTLNTIGSTINSLKNQAGLLGNEISEQVELITTFDQEVDQSQSRLGRARKRMDEMIKLGEERTGGWCVWLLVLVSIEMTEGEMKRTILALAKRLASIPSFFYLSPRLISQVLFILLIIVFLI